MKRMQFTGTGELAIRPDAVSLTWPRAPMADSVHDGVAVIRVCGPLEHRKSFWFDSYESILERFEGALQCDDVHGVILAIDSPGGEVSGLQETVRRMRELREEHGKRVVAYADEEAYSAAYALATAAEEIYLPESGGLGSIGVLTSLCDRTQMTRDAGLRIEVIRSGDRKADGHPDIPLTDDAIARVRSRVDELAGQFFELVSEARDVSTDDLAELRGGLLYGAEAVDDGLANGVSSFAEVLATFLDDDAIVDTNSGMGVVSTIVDHNGDNPMNLAALKKKVAAAFAKLQAATTAGARKSAATAYAKAVSALETAKADAKVKSKYKKKTTTVEEEEEADDGDEESEGAEDSEESDEDAADSDAADSEESDEDDDDGDDKDDDEEDEESDGKKSKKMAASSGDGDLDDFVRSITGKRSTAAARGVLQAMADTHKRAARAVAEVESLRAERRSEKRAALIESGIKLGKLSPGQRAWAKTQSIASLKAYLETAPVRFAPRQLPLRGAEGTHASADEVGTDGVTATEREICRISGVSVDEYRKARASGASIAKVN